MKIIYKSGDLLLHLLNDLLTFSGNSYGEHLAIEEETFHLVDISTQIASIFEKQAREAQIDLKVVYVGVINTIAAFENVQEKEMMDARAYSEANAYGPGGTGLVRDMSLPGDKHRILQILMNLVSNSLKFTPENGAVEIRIKCMGYAGLKLPILSRTATTTPRGRDSIVRTRPREARYTLNREVSESLTNLAFQFEVEDTGPGVSEHMQEEIFKPFVQGDLALSKKYGGTGLGLTICSRLAALMHGKIALKSAISVGSTCTLSLNLRYLKEQAASFSTATDRPGSIPSMSKPNSMVVSSFRERATSRSPVLSVRRHSPSRISLSSARDGLLPRDNMSRIVGYSQPYVTDDRHLDDHSTPQRPLTPPPAHNMIHHKLDAGGSRLTSSHSRLNTSLTVPTVVSTPPQPPQVNESRRVKDKASGVMPSSNGLNQPRVLVAEDNNINQEVVVRMLKLEKVTGKNVIPYQVKRRRDIHLPMLKKLKNIDIKVVRDGQETLDAVREAAKATSANPNTTPAFSLIFMDIQMPNINGIESTRHIRALGYAMPIVALTAFANESNRMACAEAGTNAFLSKPIKRAALKEVLKQFLVDEKCELKVNVEEAGKVEGVS